MVHYGGKTFEKNKNLIERAVDWSKWDRNEYLDTLKKSRIYSDDWKQKENGKESADRMAFSRYMFAKHWDVLSNYDAPQVPVHERIVTPMPRRRVKWLDKNMTQQEAEV